MDYQEWSELWGKLRKDAGNVDGVKSAWKIPPPRECLKMGWEFPEGYRKRSTGRGEQEIEGWFLGVKGSRKLHSLVSSGHTESYSVTGVLHNVGLAIRRPKNRIADCLGILHTTKRPHPLAVEVKVSPSAGGLWFAAVENLQQVRMLRSNVANAQKDFERRGDADFKGAWGLVLVSEKYLSKCGGEMAQVEGLLACLNAKQTRARIMVAVADMRNDIIRHVGGYWPFERALESPPSCAPLFTCP